MKHEDKIEKKNVKLVAKQRHSNKEFTNLYLYFGDNISFEVVPHCRTKKETAYFYALLLNSELMGND